MSIKRTLKEKFGYDVSGLAAWKDNTLPNITPDLVATSRFLEKLMLEEGVKGSREIALLSSSVALQAKAACTPSPDGSVVFTEKVLTTKPLYMGVEFCNETLNTKMTQVLNALGMKNQEGQLPAPLETILMAYLTKMLQKKAERLVWLGDTTSLDTELVHFDGLVKTLKADTAVLKTTTTFATLTTSNAYSAAYEVFTKIPAEIFDNQMEIALYTGRTEALAIVSEWNTANAYDRIVVTNEGGAMRFTLPQTNVEVITVPALDGQNEIFAIPTSLVFLGVDAREDENFDIKYDAYNEKLKVDSSFRLGVQYVFPQYFVKLKKA
jgi:hypothetical protein